MIIRDQILVGDGTIGNYVVGFFSCQAYEGEDAEDQILRAYRRLGYMAIKPIRKAGCFEAVEHFGLNERAPVPENWGLAMKHLRETCGDDLSNQIEMIKKYQTETQAA
jgi:hypothetical protein